MPGRLTGNARHLTDPAGKIYYATMEEGIYEVDVKSLAVTELYKDANSTKDKGGSLLPGYHGKGLYSGQGRLVYSNNGELSAAAKSRPDIPSGVLAEWQGKDWAVVRRNQFTEVTGPGGIYGNASPDTDPLWSVGWDYRSLILMLLENGKWHAFRLPKPSHAYDGAHGWNTEWPRIRDIGQPNLLMTMHGGFWSFPRTFSMANSAGINLRSTYLKVIGDFTQWNGKLVFGCDDSAKSEFLSKSKLKGHLDGPSLSNSNLWFVDPATLDSLGTPRGTGAVWLNDKIEAKQPSEPYLFSGFKHRAAHLSHNAGKPVKFSFEVDSKGNNQWTPLKDVTVPASGSAWIPFTEEESGVWIRVTTDTDCPKGTVFFTGNNPEVRPETPDPMFAGLSKDTTKRFSAGLLHSGGSDEPELEIAAYQVEDGHPSQTALYTMGVDLKLRPKTDRAALEKLQAGVAIPSNAIQSDAASLLCVAEDGTRYRFPRSQAASSAKRGGSQGHIAQRICREVCTERDLLNAGGLFYELPADNAGGFAKIRPISTNPYLLTDYCSWRGLLVLTGVSADSPDSPHVIRSEDGKCAVWVGAIDDLWKLGRPTGVGGPWMETAVKAGVPSDPYLANGFEHKELSLKHGAANPVQITVEYDPAGTGQWQVYKTLTVKPGETLTHAFPEEFAPYWIRVTTDRDCTATAQFTYK